MSSVMCVVCRSVLLCVVVLCVVHCLSVGVRCLWFVVLFVACCSLCDVCCVLVYIVCCLVFTLGALFVV